MHMIAYVSELAEDHMTIDSILEDIVGVAKSENPKHSITGVLFYIDGNFLQVIEGKERNLRSLMTNIENDARHRNVDYLIDTPVENRGFSDWNMETFNLSDTKAFNKEILKDITESFKKNLLPHSKTLLFYYKALLDAKSSALSASAA